MRASSVLPAPDQNPYDAVRFLKKRHYFTQWSRRGGTREIRGGIGGPRWKQRFVRESGGLHRLRCYHKEKTFSFICDDFLNGRPVTLWSRSQRSIALSSCESEYLSAVGGAAEGLYVGRLWRFLTQKEVAVSTITDSSSCRAFSQRQGVGRLKHIDAKFLWVQQRLKEGAMTMEGVPTLLNVSDIGTKRLTKVRRAFLMYLMGMVQYDESSDSYVAVGEWEFPEARGKPQQHDVLRTGSRRSVE